MGALIKTRQQMAEWPEWLDLRTLSAYACVSERTLREWIKSLDNPLPASQRGGKLYIFRADFDDWMRRQRVAPDVDIDAVANDIISSLIKVR